MIDLSRPPSPAQLTFIVLAGLAALMAVGVVAMNNPVRSAMCLVVNFFVLAFVYFGLGAQLLGISQILVYTGAIMVLFLFVIMLLNLAGRLHVKEKFDLKPFLGMLLGIAMFALLGSQLLVPLKDVNKVIAHADYGTPQAIGKSLFTTYVWPFEVASVLLLVGIVGSILLAKRRI